MGRGRGHDFPHFHPSVIVLTHPILAYMLIGLVILTCLSTLTISIVVLTKLRRRTVGTQDAIVLEKIEGMRGQLDDLAAGQEQEHRFMRTSLVGLLAQFKNWCK
jgi:hypothetical protein